MPELTLPPLDVTKEDIRLAEGWLLLFEKMPTEQALANRLMCRERQLLAVTTERDHALKELAKQDAGNMQGGEICRKDWLLWGRKLLNRWEANKDIEPLKAELRHLLTKYSSITDIFRSAAPSDFNPEQPGENHDK